MLFVVILRLINALDFGHAGIPETPAIRFAVETVLFTALGYGAIRSLPFGAKPGWRGTIALGLWIALVVLSDCLSRLEFGAIGAMAVYGATIAGLSLAFATGRLMPKGVFSRLLNWLGIAVPDGQLESALRGMLAGTRPRRGGWHRLATRLMEYRYLSLAVSFNLPGNSVLGGGGGIAMLCGASRQFALHWFVLTDVLATALPWRFPAGTRHPARRPPTRLGRVRRAACAAGRCRKSR